MHHILFVKRIRSHRCVSNMSAKKTFNCKFDHHFINGRMILINTRSKCLICMLPCHGYELITNAIIGNEKQTYSYIHRSSTEITALNCTKTVKRDPFLKVYAENNRGVTTRGILEVAMIVNFQRIS